MPLCAVDGMAVTTVEGIGSTKTALHPVQVIKALRNVIRNDSWFSIKKCIHGFALINSSRLWLKVV